MGYTLTSQDLWGKGTQMVSHWQCLFKPMAFQSNEQDRWTCKLLYKLRYFNARYFINYFLTVKWWLQIVLYILMWHTGIGSTL